MEPKFGLIEFGGSTSILSGAGNQHILWRHALCSDYTEHGNHHIVSRDKKKCARQAYSLFWICGRDIGSYRSLSVDGWNCYGICFSTGFCCMVYFSRLEGAGEDRGSSGIGYFINIFGLSYQADILIG